MSFPKQITVEASILPNIRSVIMQSIKIILNSHCLHRILRLGNWEIFKMTLKFILEMTLKFILDVSQTSKCISWQSFVDEYWSLAKTKYIWLFSCKIPCQGLCDPLVSSLYISGQILAWQLRCFLEWPVCFTHFLWEHF